MLNTKFDLYKTEWLDLVFTNRNKSYGAYELRKHSGEYAMRALAITMGLFIAGGVAVKLFNKPQDQTKWSKPTVFDVQPPPHVEPPHTKKQDQTIHEPVKTHPALPKVHTPKQVFAVPEVTDKPVTEDKFTAQTQITDPGLSTTKGDNIKQETIVDREPGTSDKPSGDAVDTKTIFDGVEIMPEPNGGLAAWSKFLQRNIRYPDTEAQGKVYVSFVIEPDGKLSNITLVKGVDRLLDQEALRVLKLAPAWKPGIQNGHAVRVRYSLPISFMMEQ
jgi:protein TonB